MTDKERLETFRRCGRALFWGGLNDSHSGNLSVRVKDSLWITRTGCMLHELVAKDLVEVAGDPPPRPELRASREFPAHRALYRAGGYAAVVHCHPPLALAWAMVADDLVSLTVDARTAMGPRVPVLEAAVAHGEALAGMLAKAMAGHRAVLVRGHGVFAVGDDLEQATWRAFQVERTAQLTVAARGLGADLAGLAAKPYLAASE
ncbi:MAG: class II aldolase/adducin family protein [Thermaerobacter sp.]|nr:class II aldolase/adducin family protein [Thermaerobacter sp.]